MLIRSNRVFSYFSMKAHVVGTHQTLLGKLIPMGKISIFAD